MKPKLDEPIHTPRQIYEQLGRSVIGQERAKRAVAVAAYNHMKRIGQRKQKQGRVLKKSNILLIGPTGSGKTHLARNLAEILSVPFAVVDATEYTEAGYYGKDVEVMVAELLLKSNHALEEAQHGIIFIDEVDKIARRTQGARTGAGARDIGGEGVQQALLKLLEGREVFVPLNVTQHWSKHDFVQIDTTDILFICAGTFSDLHEDYEDRARENKRLVGFGAQDATRIRPRRRITVHDLLDYGMLAEFLGRLPVMVQLEALTDAELFQVLTVPPDALVHEYREALAMDDVELNLTDGALREVVRYVREKGVGARGLRALLEEVMAEVMFEAPERRGSRLGVDAHYVRRRLQALNSDVLRER
jgi:ATP-dependent Clp protease ATP-binding subunit ClpX